MSNYWRQADVLVKHKFGSEFFPSMNCGGSCLRVNDGFHSIGYMVTEDGQKWDAVVNLRGFRLCL